MTPGLRAAIVEAARRLAPDVRRNLVSILGQVSRPEDLSSPVDAPLVRRLRDAWEQDGGLIGGETLAAALDAAGTAVDAEREASRVGLVLTGPATAGPAPRIEQSLISLIDAAQHELLLTTFVAYRAVTVTEALRRALRRGVRTTLVLETVFDGEDSVDFGDAMHVAGDVLRGSTVLVWPLEQRPRGSGGGPARVHAKIAVADRSRALVSSANLTGFAMDINIEAGVTVRGSDVGGRLHRYFEQLQNEGILQVWRPPPDAPGAS